MIDIHSLNYFKKAAELQHITQAAETLHVAQPAISRTISQLERDLGYPLFDRKGKSITLNSYGRIVLKYTNRIFQNLEDMSRELADTQTGTNQTVTLSLYAASKLFPELVMAFKKEHPSIRLKVIQQNLENPSGSECDLTLFSSYLPVEDSNAQTLFVEDIYLALPETNPLSRREALDLNEVAGEEFICLQKGKSLRKITDMYCQIAGFEPSVILESDSPETVRELVRAGIGISFVPSVTWRGMETEHIVLVPISFPRCRRYINLSWRNDGYFSPAAQFRDFVEEYFLPYRKM